MSPGNMALVVPVSGEPGERIIAYIDHLGGSKAASPARSPTASP